MFIWGRAHWGPVCHANPLTLDILRTQDRVLEWQWWAVSSTPRKASLMDFPPPYMRISGEWLALQETCGAADGTICRRKTHSCVFLLYYSHRTLHFWHFWSPNVWEILSPGSNSLQYQPLSRSHPGAHPVLSHSNRRQKMLHSPRKFQETQGICDRNLGQKQNIKTKAFQELLSLRKL